MLAECIIVGFLFVMIILVALWCYKQTTPEKVLLLGFIILLFTIIFAISFMNYKISGVVDIAKEAKEVRIAKNEVDDARDKIKEMQFEIAADQEAIKNIAKATAEIAILNYGQHYGSSWSSTELTMKKDEIRERLSSAINALGIQGIDFNQLDQIYHVSGEKPEK